MKCAHIVLLIVTLYIPLYLFIGISSAEDWTNTKSTNRNLHVCSSGIRNNACDTSKQKSGDANGQLPALPGDERVETDYMSHVESVIAMNFILPRGFYNDLSAIVVMKLSRNGNATRKDFEKRSGNPDFDMAAMRAINAATPFGPPPRQLTEVGIRVIFHP